MGTPEFAAVSLRSLLKWQGGRVVGVYCQPDRPAGRGQALQTGPVKKLTLEHGLPVMQPQNFKTPGWERDLAAFEADIIVVAAYGLILPTPLLSMAPLGTINVHGSLLPEYRGAAPIQRAVMAGDFRTGITIMRVEPKLDSGPILLQRALAIGLDETAGELHDELARLGGELLVETLERLREGRLHEQKQDESKVTYAAKLGKQDGVLDFNHPARQVHNQARGVTPWPGAQVLIQRTSDDGRSLEPIKAIVEKGLVLRETGPSLDDSGVPFLPGVLLPLCAEGLPVACADGLYGIARLRPSGGKSMEAAAFANGYLKNCAAEISW